jgi:hypothetical protein
MQGLHRVTLNAFESGTTALDRAFALGPQPDQNGVDDVSALLDAATREFGRASAELDLAKSRLPTP